MGYTGTTIKNVLNMIDSGDMILPALQRNYVWKEEQICFLFDSLMKGYPIGTFLFWRVEADELSEYVFNEFVTDVDLIENALRGDWYLSDDNAESETKPVHPKQQAYAVLDGQQRITSLRVGLRGSYRSKVSADRKIDGDYPKRYLYLNLLHPISNTAEDSFDFQFLSKSESEIRDFDHYWFKVSDIIDLGLSKNELSKYVRELKIHTDADPVFDAIDLLNKLYSVVWEEQTLSYYEAVNKELSEVVEIFERINNNGKPLSGTDLILSITSASNREDMQRRVFEAIKRIENATDDTTGFVPDREFILIASLMAIETTTSLSTSNKDNLRPEIIEQIDKNWSYVIDAIETAAVYIEKLGFKGNKIGKSFLQPIVYYFFKIRGNKQEAIDADKYYQDKKPDAQCDRANIMQWILRAQIKQIFAYGIPSTLLSIRNVMNKSMVGPVKNQFPLGALIQASSGEKSLIISKDDIDEIVGWKYGNPKTEPLLTAVLNPGLFSDLVVDHMWPQAKMSTDAKIKKAFKECELDAPNVELLEFYKSHYNLMPNLQVIRNYQNLQKNDEFFKKWVEDAYPIEDERDIYLQSQGVPKDESLEYASFESFYAKREALLITKLKAYFDVVDEDGSENGIAPSLV